jgi:cytochrome c oxidase subunit 3
MQSNTIQNNEEANYVINPKKFVLWLFIVASVMLFAGFTSAYIVRRGEGNWEVFSLPSLFALNTVFILLSSLFIQLSYSAAKKNQFGTLKTFLGIAFLLGIGFVFGQWFAWKQLVADNVFFAFSNPSNSFVYVISGVHLFHVFGGLVFMLLMLIQALQQKIHQGTLLFLNMCITYWHFIGILWIYLYLFLYLYR